VNSKLPEGVKMAFHFQPMDETCARAIAAWHYESVTSFYDMDQDAEDLAELLDPHSWPDHYYAVMDAEAALDTAGEELVGFFCFEAEQDVVSIGLGLRPDLTGKGLGRAFCEAGLQFAREKFHPRTFALDVATFNARAIALYHKLGFQDSGISLQESNGGYYEFLHMVREA